MSFSPAMADEPDTNMCGTRDTWTCDCGHVEEGETVKEKREARKDAEEQEEREHGDARP